MLNKKWYMDFRITIEADCKKKGQNVERRCVYYRFTSVWEKGLEKNEPSHVMAVLMKKTISVDRLKTDLIPIWDNTRSTDSESHREAAHIRQGQGQHHALKWKKREDVWCGGSSADLPTVICISVALSNDVSVLLSIPVRFILQVFWVSWVTAGSRVKEWRGSVSESNQTFIILSCIIVYNKL